VQTYPANALAEQFECDRSTMLRALRGVPADETKKGNRPCWKVATAAKALEAHRRKQDGVVNLGPDPTLAALYARYDDAEKAMRALPTLDERRAAARDLVPLINEVDAASRRIAVRNGQDAELVGYRCDHMLKLYGRGVEGATGWTHDEVMRMIGETGDA
jgi:hypothetical protein